MHVPGVLYMNKVTIALASCGGAIALGMILMSVGTQAVLEDVAQGYGEVSSNQPLEIMVDMDSGEYSTTTTTKEGENGVFAVQMQQQDTDQKVQVTATVLDPFGSTIASIEVESESVEERFDVDADGTYTLVIQNDAASPINTFGAIGPVPDPGSRALAFVPFYMLLAGIMGMAGIAMYWVASMRRRAKNNRGF